MAAAAAASASDDMEKYDMSRVDALVDEPPTTVLRCCETERIANYKQEDF